MKSINLFGKDIYLKTKYCSLFGNEGESVKEPYTTIYLQTKNCNASCKFCEYHSSANIFNTKKYKEILTYISERIKIRKIGVTGGEPTLNWDNFIKISEISKEVSPNSELSLNTNGFNWDKLITHTIFKEYDAINISRHHYDDEINSKIFNTNSLPSSDIKQMISVQTHNHQLQFRCNLIKGYIDSNKEIFKYLEWVNKMGLKDVGFISLMPINDYSIENKISINIKDLIGDNLFLTQKWERCEGGCECSNFIYTPEENFENPIIVYQKNTFNPCSIKEVLVFDGENLRIGFGGEIIY